MKQFTELTKQSGGIPIAMQDGKLIGLDSTEPRKVLCCGPSGCGKSYNFMLPNLLEAIERGEPIVVTDPLGVLEEHASEVAKEHGYEIVRVDARSESTEHWDLQQLRPCKEFSVEDFCEWATIVFKMLTPADPHSDEDIYFELESAMFSATIQYAIEKCDAHSFRDVLDVYMSDGFSKKVKRSVRALVPRVGVRKKKAHARQKALEKLRDWSPNLKGNISMAVSVLFTQLAKGGMLTGLAGQGSFRFDQVWDDKKTLVFIRPSNMRADDLSRTLLWYLTRCAENQNGRGTILIDDCVNALELLENPQEEFQKLTAAGKHVLFDVQNFAQLTATLGDEKAQKFVYSFDAVVVSGDAYATSIFNVLTETDREYIANSKGASDCWHLLGHGQRSTMGKIQI